MNINSLILLVTFLSTQSVMAETFNSNEDLEAPTKLDSYLPFSGRAILSYHDLMRSNFYYSCRADDVYSYITS